MLLTGGIPFWGNTEADLYRKICSGKYSLPNKGKKFTKNLKNLLDSIFQPSASKRISAKLILEHPWLK